MYVTWVICKRTGKKTTKWRSGIFNSPAKAHRMEPLEGVRCTYRRAAVMSWKYAYVNNFTKQEPEVKLGTWDNPYELEKYSEILENTKGRVYVEWLIDSYRHRWSRRQWNAWVMMDSDSACAVCETRLYEHSLKSKNVCCTRASRWRLRCWQIPVWERPLCHGYCRWCEA